MRVITGTARGKKLAALQGDQVRPTPDRVKEALYNIIQFEVEGRVFLDLFAGSGQIGIEALSRGAKLAVFVDASKESAAVVEQNLKATGFSDKAKVVLMDSMAFLMQKHQKFDIAFLDPPYRSGLLERALDPVAEGMNLGGSIICEHPKDEELPDSAGEFQKAKSYRYGRICLTIYRHKDVLEQ